MSLDNHVAFSGYLARLTGSESPHDVFAHKPDTTNFRQIGTSRWHAFSWKPKDWLVTPNLLRQGQATPAEHTFLFRQSSDRFIVLSDQTRVADLFLKSFGRSYNIEYPLVQIQAIVKELLVGVPNMERRYRLCSLFASRSSSTALKTIGVWGEDISNDEFFARFIPEVVPYRIGLGDADGSKEIASIGSGGEISMFFRSALHLRNVDSLIRHLTDRSHIHWSNLV
jgi:hypothetical protein